MKRQVVPCTRLIPITRIIGVPEHNGIIGTSVTNVALQSKRIVGIGNNRQHFLGLLFITAAFNTIMSLIQSRINTPDDEETEHQNTHHQKLHCYH